MSESPEPPKLPTQPDRCPCGEQIRPDPPEPDGVRTWKCECRRFGFLLPPDYLKTHPEEPAVQVCGRKRLTRVPAPAAV